MKKKNAYSFYLEVIPYFSENHHCRNNKCLLIKGKLDVDSVIESLID
jgi:hypothetical protein